MFLCYLEESKERRLSAQHVLVRSVVGKPVQQLSSREQPMGQ